MADAEVQPEGPAWMLALEKKRQRVHRLAHEVGAGSPCLLCQDDCPGLDLHFWRKICRNCKCKKEDHDVIDDCGAEQFEILLGSGHSTNRPNKAFLEMLEKHTSAGLKKQVKNGLDWIPPDVSPVIAAEYMQALPTSKLPISGSDGALYRRQQLERQLPLHDLDASQCHQLTDVEVDNLKKYLENLKNNVVGQGRVTKLHVPASNSLDSLSKVCTFNSVPKPFQPTSGNSSAFGQSPQFTIGGHINSGHAAHLKPPSAFWPKSISPEPPRSVSPASVSSDAPLPSVADRGAAFGVTLSPARGTRPLPKLSGVTSGLSGGSVPANQGRSSPSNFVGAHLIKDQTPISLIKSTNVPGNMWVPADCKECSKHGVDGQLISNQVCTHIANSSDLPQMQQPSECADCLPKGVDVQLVMGQVCSHVINSTDLPQLLQPSQCLECLTKRVDGKLASDRVCTHVINPTEHPHLLQPSKCGECFTKGVDGKLVIGQVCSHVINSTDLPQIMQPYKCTECVRKLADGQMIGEQVCSHVSHSGIVPQKMQPSVCSRCVKKGPDGEYFADPDCSHVVASDNFPGQPLPAPCSECTSKGLDGQLVRKPICAHLTQTMDSPHEVLSEQASALGAKGVTTLAHPTHKSFATSLQNEWHPLGESDRSKGLEHKICMPPSMGITRSSPLPPTGDNYELPTSLKATPIDEGKTSPIPTSVGGSQAMTTLPDLRVPSPLSDSEFGSLSRNRSPTSMMSSPGAPHMMALYAHNALNNPSSLDPQDTLSPHVASMSIEEERPIGVPTDNLLQQPTDSVPAVDLKLHCAQCKEDIFPGEVVVFADRAGPEVVWHPKCFVCNICQELLVDLVYFFNKDRVYCGRHYAEILDIPRCSACDELIFVKEYTVAEGQAFHVKHFCCFECDDPLGGKQYVPKEGQPVCLPCYERKYGKQCETCRLVIGAKDQGVPWKDLHWHATPVCFCCNFCKKSLLGGRFAVKDQRPFCSKECMQAGLSVNHQKVSAV